MTSAGWSDVGSGICEGTRKNDFFMFVFLWRRVWCETMRAAVFVMIFSTGQCGLRFG